MFFSFLAPPPPPSPNRKIVLIKQPMLKHFFLLPQKGIKSNKYYLGFLKMISQVKFHSHLLFF